jgi:CRISPR-associated protein Csa3
LAKNYRKINAEFFDVSIIQVDKRDILYAACELTSIIRKEQVEGNIVVINFSGSLRTFSIAGYISECMTPLRKEHINIITVIGDRVPSFEVMVFKINPYLKKISDEFPKERSRLSHQIKNIEKMGLTVKEKIAKNEGIWVTVLGEMIRRGRLFTYKDKFDQ